MTPLHRHRPPWEVTYFGLCIAGARSDVQDLMALMFNTNKNNDNNNNENTTTTMKTKATMKTTTNMEPTTK